MAFLSDVNWYEISKHYIEEVEAWDTKSNSNHPV
jgi:hypothetical protein